MSQDSQAKRHGGDRPAQCLDGYETPEVAHYIHDMLASMQDIAMHCEMRALEQLLATARNEARQHF